MRLFSMLAKPVIDKSGATETELSTYVDDPQASVVVKEMKRDLFAMAKEISDLILKTPKTAMHHPKTPHQQPPRSDWMRS